ncbi:hypothetical protein B0H16DRAFT_342573 [Mycena metata]|nr:hypothetical protein B0H16DRAFT_342573 [Mycena metata]
MVEVVITRHPRRPKSTANTESATAAGPDPKTKARNRTPNLAQGSTTPMNRPTVPFFTQYHHLFDLGTLPPRPRPTLITQYIPGFDLMTLPPKPTPAAALPQLVTRHQNLFDLSTLKLRRPPRVLPEEPKPLLSAPIFRECIWTTEFFQKSLSLKPLLQDESLTAYWPFIERLNNLNDSGIPRAPESRVAPQFRNTIFFDEDPDLRTVNVNLASFSYSWGCVLRFQLLDMLLRCKGYKQATTTGLNGNTVPQGSNQVHFTCSVDHAV